MQIRFASRGLAKLYSSEEGVEEYPADVIDGFFYHLQAICAAKNIEDLLKLHSFPMSKSAKGYKLSLGLGWFLHLSIESSEGSQNVKVDMLKKVEVS